MDVAEDMSRLSLGVILKLLMDVDTDADGREMRKVLEIYTRRPVDDYQLGGYLVPARAYIQVCPFVVHRNPRFFTNPDSFVPQRWTSGELADRHPFSYLPFGSGAHRCIGEALASIQAMVVLATLGQQFRLRLRPGFAPRAAGMITVRPADGMPMTVETRH